MTMTYTHVMQIENNLSVTKPSMLSGLENTMVLDITFEQYDAWRDGTLIQDAMPNLTPDEREFLMTGITSEEWDKEYKEEDMI
tara:strand:- start:205 stop:453 length:249 start_codon:yes stop_codon:yes gene_type:complete